MSKSELKPKAKELYTIHQMSLADISRRLNISTRTLQNWKSEDHWEETRAEISGGEKNFHAELFSLGEVMARKIKQDELDGVKSSAWKFFSPPLISARVSSQRSSAFQFCRVRVEMLSRRLMSARLIWWMV